MATFGTFVSGQVLTAAELNTAGTWSDYTPTWTQSATITKTVNWARYTQLNKWVQGSIKMTATGAGTSSNDILIGLPVAASSNNYVVGHGIYFLASGSTTIRPIFAVFNSSTTMKFCVTDIASATTFLGATGVASGDVWHLHFSYEAA